MTCEHKYKVKCFSSLTEFCVTLAMLQYRRMLRDNKQESEDNNDMEKWRKQAIEKAAALQASKMSEGDKWRQLAKQKELEKLAKEEQALQKCEASQEVWRSSNSMHSEKCD